MPDDKKQLARGDTSFHMDRAEAIKFKLMPDGHIRGVQTQRPDLASAAEWMIYFTNVCAPTISVAHVPKLLITDEAILESLMRSVKRQR
jgi:hypothetical protein